MDSAPSSPLKLIARLLAAGLVLGLLAAPALRQPAAAQGQTRAVAKAHKRRPAPRRRRAPACRPSKRHRCPRSKHKAVHRRPAKRALPRRPPLPPAVVTGTAQMITGSSATVIGAVNPGGHPATYWFQYGTNSGYGQHTSAQRAGSGRTGHWMSAALAGLSPLSVYHFRIVASNCNGCSAGTAYGNDVTLATGGYANAVYGAGEAADPFVLDNGGAHTDYWSFDTGNLFPILHSADLVHWTTAGTAMTGRPAWALQSGDWHPWAPNVVQLTGACPGTSSSSCYVMYYVSVSAQFSVNCVAVATATAPGGPYTDQGPLSNGTLDATGRPIGCGDDSGYGLIDPSLFVDPATGRRYLYISEDFACPAASSSCSAANSTLSPTISVLELSSDYLHVVGARTPLFSGDPGTWESADVGVPTVEGPNGMLHNGTYYILYSGGNWRSQYGMGYATAPTPTGPFTKAPFNPILARTASVLGPGGGDTPVIGPHGGTWTVYHGRDGSDANPRTLRIDPFSWRSAPPQPDVPVIGGPTATPQPSQP